jgi:glycosyltransferase involved in cell wall biosynthesis
MRVTFVLPEVNLGGGIRVVVNHAERLARRGHRVVVVAGPNERRTLVRRVKDVVRGRAPFRMPRTSHFDDSRVDLRVARRAPITEADVPDADVVVATWWETAEWTAALSPKKGAKAYFIQGDDAETPGQPRERVRATWHMDMHKITIAKWLVDRIHDETRSDDVSLVPNGVDVELFHAVARDRGSPPTIGYVYQPLHMKGCDIIAAAFTRARERVPSLRGLSFGASAPTPDCPLPDWIQFELRPTQARIREIYAACDAWAWGSRIEGFGLPILEAMACRTPVVATPAGAAPSLLVKGGGVLVGHEDPSAMADALVLLATADAATWRRHSDAAHETAADNTCEKAAERFEGALARAIERGGVPRSRDAAAS